MCQAINFTNRVRVMRAFEAWLDCEVHQCPDGADYARHVDRATLMLIFLSRRRALHGGAIDDIIEPWPL